MIQDIEAILYTAGLLERGMHPPDLPVKIFKGTTLTSSIREVLQQTNILNRAGTYGDESVGYPLEYDMLTIELTDDTVEIKFFNRGITILTTNDDKLRRIHRSVCKSTRNDSLSNEPPPGCRGSGWGGYSFAPCLRRSSVILAFRGLDQTMRINRL